MLEISDNFSFISAFEKKLCEFTGFDEAIAVDCCTHAIQLSFEAMALAGVANREEDVLTIPDRTYMSVPMTLANAGWNVELRDVEWEKSYPILRSGSPVVYDAAVDFRENMAEFYPSSAFVCLSFQQKKRLPLGRGGAVLLKKTMAEKYGKLLHQLSYDGRDIPLGDAQQIASCPETLLRGFHFYMEPEKAAQGILLLNQPAQLQPWKKICSSDYPSLRNVPCLKTAS